MDLQEYFTNWCFNAGVIDNHGLRISEIDYDPRFDEEGNLINIYNPYATDNSYIYGDDNFNDGDL
tara:strand:- start:1662 stop:1856 length:195 start_codon:yes stop_codon:yes gene_type:complete